MSEIRIHPAKPSLASNLSKLMSGIKSTDQIIDKPTSILNDKSTKPLVDKPTSILNDKSTKPLVDKPTSILNDKSTKPLVDKPTSVLNDKSTKPLVDKPTSVLNDKSTKPLVDKPTDRREESPIITGTTNKKPPKNKLINKGFYIEPLDFAALSFYAVSEAADKSAIIRRLIRENIPKHFYEMAKANQKNDGE